MTREVEQALEKIREDTEQFLVFGFKPSPMYIRRMAESRRKLAEALASIGSEASNAVIDSIRAEFDGPLRGIKMNREQYVNLATNAAHAAVNAVQREVERAILEAAKGKGEI